ncbi:hypothetical protein AB0J43_25740, partial [Nonomuraea fuscirosea]
TGHHPDVVALVRYTLDDQGRQPREHNIRKIVDLQHGTAWQASPSATTDYEGAGQVDQVVMGLSRSRTPK